MKAYKTALVLPLAAALGFAAAASAQDTPPPPQQVPPTTQPTSPTQSMPQSTPPGQQAPPTSPMRQTQSKPPFGQIDSNQDGRLDRSELPPNMHDLRSHYMQYDTNGDGSLSTDEYAGYSDPGARPQQQR